MHALLAHLYHLALYAIHIATRPVWRPLGACLGVALGGRFAGAARQPGGTALVAGLAVACGWCVEAPPLAWPLPPIARLSGLAVLLTVGNVLRGHAGRGWLAPVVAAPGAWWLCGAPLDRSVLGCLPVFLGLWAALASSAGLARLDRGWAVLAAAAGLAGGLLVSGASPHWARAAGVPAMAAVGLLGVADAMPVIAGLIAAMALAALIASDRGRLAPVDVACAAPLLAWALVRHLDRRFGRGGGLAVCGFAVAACVALAWAATRAMALL